MLSNKTWAPGFLYNPSNMTQMRWARIGVPFKEAKDLPEWAAFQPHGFYAKRGTSLADHTTFYHVLADMKEKQVLFGRIEPVEGIKKLPWESTEWSYNVMYPYPVFYFHIEANGKVFSLELDTRKILYEDEVVRETLHYCDPVNGWHGKVWTRHWTMQDVVDIVSGYALWSNRDDPSVTHNITRLYFSTKTDLHLDFADKLGYRKLQSNGFLLLENTHVTDGMMIPVHGALLCQQPNVNDENEYEFDRLDNIEAARGGAIEGLAGKWDNNLLAFGSIPKIPEGMDIASYAQAQVDAFEQSLLTPGSLWDAKGLALAKNTGRTGAQPPFGAQKDLVAVSIGHPGRIREIRYGALDFALRHAHHRERDGSLLRHQDHLGCYTWSLVPDERTSSDLLGKGRPLPGGWDHGRGMMDDQHRGGAYVWLYYALTGDPMYKDILDDFIEVDSMRSMKAHGWIDAPRAHGRLCQDWAKMSMLMETSEVMKTIQLIIDEFHLWVDKWPFKHLNHPDISVPSIVQTDIRVLDPNLTEYMWIPWQDSLWNLGTLEGAMAIYKKIGDIPVLGQMIHRIKQVAKTVVMYGVVQDSIGEWHPLNGVAYNKDGTAQSSSYYTFPRTGASYISGSGIDMLVGRGGWWYWNACSILVCAHLMPNTTAGMRAQHIANKYLKPGNAYNSEWMALPELT